MNNTIISEIYSNYNNSPYFRSGEYLAINDDRVGRIVLFKLYNDNSNIIADFMEISQIQTLNRPIRTERIKINSYEDFKIKWKNFYNDIH